MSRLAYVFTVLVATSPTALAQVVTATAPPATAQYVDAGGLSLDAAIARAIAQEPSLRATRTALDVAAAMRQQAGLRPNPTVTFERREEPRGTDNQTMAGVQWPLDLFRRGTRVAVADRELTATELEVRDRERLLAADVRAAYGSVVRAIRDLSILDELIEATTRQHELLRARVEEGATPPLERDLVSVEVQRLLAERALQRANVEAAIYDLKRAAGIPAEEIVKVRDDLEAIVRRELTPAISTEVRRLVEQRADVRAADARIAVAEARIDRAEREGRFDVSLTASYMRMDAGFPQRGFAMNGGLERVRGVFQYFTGGLMVMTPLFNRNQGEIAAARAERRGAAATLDAVRVAAGNELAAALARDTHTRRAVQVFTGGALTLARQNLAVVTETFGVGRVTVFDVLAEQRRYLDLERAYTEALGAAFEARTALRRAIRELP
jgi:outer membrane protein, heavy metal efflux system